MVGKILVPTDLSAASNSIFPYAVTLAQAFHSKLYLMHVMDPASLNEPERLEDFPRLANFFTSHLDSADLPPLKKSVPVAKMYSYNKNPSKTILDFARTKQVDLIAMASTDDGVNLAWWSAGRMTERIIRGATCSVLCMRGRAVKEKDWKRPRFKHILLLMELNPAGSQPLLKVLPWVQKFNSLLHIFPLVNSAKVAEQEVGALQHAADLGAAHTNVLLFARPENRVQNLIDFVGDTPIDLIAMAPRTRGEFSNRLVSDILVKLLKVTESPILLLR
jgi:nucleotide-binding universal stress UspA family protein